MNFIKSKKGRIILIAAAAAIVVLAVILFLLFAGGEKGYRSISISEIFGNVLAENNGNEYDAYPDMKLYDGYALTTAEQSYSRLVLDGDKYIKLEENSRALFEQLGKASSGSTTIRLERGAITNELTKPLKQDESYVINTPNAVLAVRGTYFRVEVRFTADGVAYTNVYVYSGAVTCRRIMPDGSIVDEEIVIGAGYKACVRMDEIITVYVEELTEQGTDNIDPIDPDEIVEADIVGMYVASKGGHEMFLQMEELKEEIAERNIKLEQHFSQYDGKPIEPLEINDDEHGTAEDGATAETEESDGMIAETVETTDTDESAETTESADTQETLEPEETAESADTEEADEFDGTTGSTDTDEPTNPEGTTGSPDTEETTEPDETTESSDTEETTEPDETTESTDTEETTEPDETTESTDTEEITEPDETTESTDTEETTEPDETTESSDTEETTESDETNESSDAEDTEDENTGGSGSGGSGSGGSGSGGGGSGGGGSSGGGSSGGGGGGSGGGSSGAHTHEWETVTEPATCTEDGKTTVKCKTCDEVSSEDTIPATGHTEITEITEPTTTAEGRRLVYCDVCSEVITDEVLPKFALYTDDGDIVITTTGYSVGGAEETPYTGDYVIKQNSGSAQTSYITVQSGTHNISLDGININGAFEVRSGATVTLSSSGGAVITGSSAALSNSGTLTITSGSFTLSGGTNDISSASAVKITGGSLRLMHDTAAATITNGTDTLECVVFDAFPSEVERTFTKSDSTTYVYSLTEADSAADGKYYVWKPIAAGLALNSTNFPDSTFLSYVTSNFDTNADGYLSDTEIAAATDIDVTGTVTTDGGVGSLEGIEHFTALTTLKCGYNSSLTALDISANTALTKLYCYNTSVASLDVSQNAALTLLYCSNSPITALDVSANAALTALYCVDTHITTLDVSNNTALEELDCSGNSLSAIDVGRNVALTRLCCSNTNITSLNVGANTALAYLDCGETGITSLDLVNNTALQYLYCDSLAITSLDVSYNTALEFLHCNDTGITSIDVFNNTALTRLYCYNTGISELNLTNNVLLEDLMCHSNALAYVDVSNNTNLYTFRADGNAYIIPTGATEFDLSTISGFNASNASGWTNCTYDSMTNMLTGITGDVTYTYACGNGKTETFTLSRTG